jgi:Chaperone of endosialidase
MTMFPGFRATALTSGFAAIAALTIVAQAPNAQASTSLSQCSGSSRQSVINCCQKTVKIHRPSWMGRETSCKSVVYCGGKAQARRCKVVPQDIATDHPAPPGRGQQSDIRLKTDIHRVGTTVLNLPLYTFEYRGRAGTYLGVMAQDVLKVEPSAVSVGANGYYLVDYGKLGIAMKRIQ